MTMTVKLDFYMLAVVVGLVQRGIQVLSRSPKFLTLLHQHPEMNRAQPVFYSENGVGKDFEENTGSAP